MKKIVLLLVFLLVFSIALTPFTSALSETYNKEVEILGSQYDENLFAPDSPTDLRVDMITNPLGIADKDPSFSWVVNDKDYNEIQTAYRIIVSSTTELNGDIKNTGWINSDQNTDVHIDGIASLLNDNSLYYWQVQTKDKGSLESPLSDAATFMTDIASQWKSTKGIWVGDPGVSTAEWSNYTIEQKMSISTGNALALLVRVDAKGKNGYMVQVRNADNCVKVHRLENGIINTTPFTVINNAESGVTLPTDSSPFLFKIYLHGSAMEFYFDTTCSKKYTHVGSSTITSQGNLLSGTFGYRTGGQESGYIDDLTVTDTNNKIMYSSDFSVDDNRFPGLSAQDGVLKVTKSCFSIFASVNYVIEQKLSIQSGNAFAILARMDSIGKNGYMVQFRDADNCIKIHKITNGSINGTAFQILNLGSSGVALPTDKSEFGVKIECKNSNLNIFVDPKLTGNYVSVGEVNVSSQGDYKGEIFGYRTGGQESGTVDNLVYKTVSGSVIYQTDFSGSENRFSNSKIENGKLSVGRSAFSLYQDPNAPLSPLRNYVFIRSPKLQINSEGVSKAVVSISARGTNLDRATICDIFFNGKCLGAGSARELQNVGNFSGASNYTQVYYNSYDVTSLLQADNVIGVVANCRDENRGILVQMTLFKNDGSKEIISNSGSDFAKWRVLDGTTAFGDTGALISTGYINLLHDNINANTYPMGWYNINFDDSKWSMATAGANVADNVSGTSGRVLYPFCSENAQRIETSESTKSVYINQSGNLVIDLGKEIIGGLKVNMSLSSPQTVTVHEGEELNADGTVKYQLSAKPVYEDKWKLIAGVNKFETVTMRNFRYVELIGLDEATKNALIDNPNYINGWAIQQPFDYSASDFSATDKSDASTLLNRLYELSKYTIKATNQDLFVDSQARERAAYEGDLLVNSNTSYAVSNNYSLARHSNEWLIDNPTWPNDYSLFSVEMAYYDYIYTGNIQSIQKYYDALKKKLTVKVTSEDSSTGLITVGNSTAGCTALIDWPTSERDGYVNGYYDVVINCEYVGIYDYMSRISAALGKTGDANTYAQKSAKLKASLIKYAYDASNGCFYDSLSESYEPTLHSSTHASAYALAYNVYDSREMSDRLCDFVYGKCKEQFKGSVYVTYFILKGLYNGNHGEYAEKLLTNPKVGTNVKTFASVLDDLNCTITPEAWGHQWKSNMTLSHPWGAAPGSSIVQGMFGINPTSAGFSHFNIKLQMGDITSAEVKTPTVKGNIKASFKNYSVGKKVSVTIPANTTADIYIPANSSSAKIFHNDKALMGNYENGFVKVTLGSGEYKLTLTDSGYLWGDVDRNETVDATDALLTLQASIELIQFDDEQKIIGDVDLDKSVNSVDALFILKKSVELVDDLPLEI